jgi:hypothetical protein
MITHKKVIDFSVVLAIPKGIKCFAWFTKYNNTNICLSLEINSNHDIVDVQIISTNFIDKLSLGTIFYGTLFTYKNQDFFSIEDLYYYNGQACYNKTYLTKLEIIKDILTNEIYQTVLFNKCTIFGLPLMSNQLQLILKDIPELPYNISEIKYRFFDNKSSKKIFTMKYFMPNISKQNFKKTAIFKITADIEPDIYNLFIHKNGIEEYYDLAFIPDYKTSVMMNKLFRNIKENDNLDAIEESDNEEEFQDDREDKYVYLDKSFNMICEYNDKFKRWKPVSLAGHCDKIMSLPL